VCVQQINERETDAMFGVPPLLDKDVYSALFNEAQRFKVVNEDVMAQVS